MSKCIENIRCVRWVCQPTSQQYCSRILNQHRPPATSQSAIQFSHNKSAPVISHSQANTAKIWCRRCNSNCSNPTIKNMIIASTSYKCDRTRFHTMHATQYSSLYLFKYIHATRCDALHLINLVAPNVLWLLYVLCMP